MSRRSNRRAHFAAAASAALLLTGLTAGSAAAASTDVTYTCGPAGPLTVSIDPGTLPSIMTAGQRIAQPTSAVVHLTQGQVNLLETALNAKAVDGTADAASSSTLPFKLDLTKTDLPSPAAAVDVPASGPSNLRYASAGSKSVDAGDFTGNLVVTKSDNSTQPFALPCTAPVDGSNHLGDIAVSKDSSKTTSSAKYVARRHLAKVHSKSVGRTYRLSGKGGKVVFTLFKAGTKIGTARDTANAKGVASAVFKGKKVAKHGKYVVKVAYKGNPGLKASRSKTSFKVS